MIDTHSHIYDEAFDADRPAVVERAIAAGVQKIILPNIDGSTIEAMLALETSYPEVCYAAIGLHPTSVKKNYQDELALVEAELKHRTYIAVGEIGIDLYWDSTFKKEQISAFQQQVEWALDYNLPIIIHLRNSHQEVMQALQPYKNKGLRGVFHSFGGNIEEARDILNFGGFYIGINGVVTFKNSNLGDVLKQVDLKHILLETDAPYLTPVPFRGKRNESAYIIYIAQKLSEIYNITVDAVIARTTQNAKHLFQLSNLG